MMMVRTRHNQKGVTLIEALVAMSVFALALSLILGIMNNSMRQQRKVNAEQKVASNARDVIEAIAREVRMDSIDYYKHKITHSEDLIDSTDHLYLKQSGGQPLEFTYNDINDNAELNGVQINSNDVEITGLSFFIRPTSDPFYIKSCEDDSDCAILDYPVEPSGKCLSSGMCKLVNDQPRVTIVLSAQLRNITDPTKQSTIDLQTTVTTRRYQR
jgi:prepilin-type N-terminal cleavage/methylation domain-containing protein